MEQKATIKELTALCKKRGFVFLSSEIYGGIGSTYDYGHYGVLLKQNVKEQWWQAMLRKHDNIVALDSAIIQSPQVWKASGHLDGFSDPLVQCLGDCKKRWRLDHLQEAAQLNQENPEKVDCPECKGILSKPKDFNLMFETFIGPVQSSENKAYLRPETAQGIFINFKQTVQALNKKPPFGIAQIGKSFRNEISPGQFIFRMREFEQMEMEFFVHPDNVEEWYQYWQKTRYNWYTDLGINPNHLRLREHKQAELAHYSSQTSDIEYLFPMGFSELEGIADRGDFDLRAHAENSSQTGEITDLDNVKFVPHVIEPAAGCDRATMAFLYDAFCEEKLADGKTRTLLKLHPKLAPVKAAVLPLLKKEGQPEKAREIFNQLKQTFCVEYDEKGSIGKRYRRQDEIGTPWCFTIDHQTAIDNTVTVRDRDTLEQSRLLVEEIEDWLEKELKLNNQNYSL